MRMLSYEYEVAREILIISIYRRRGEPLRALSTVLYISEHRASLPNVWLCSPWSIKPCIKHKEFLSVMSAYRIAGWMTAISGEDAAADRIRELSSWLFIVIEESSR
jgi:hypothetical protein